MYMYVVYERERERERERELTVKLEWPSMLGADSSRWRVVRDVEQLVSTEAKLDCTQLRTKGVCERGERERE